MAESTTTDVLSMFALPVYLSALLIEALISRGSTAYAMRDSLNSLAMLIAAAVVEILPRLAFVGLMLVLAELSPLKDIVQRQWWAWLLLFLLDDFTYYWFHRANHSVRLLWAGHVNHHSSKHFNLATALRQGVGERVPKLAFWLWLPLLGFDVAMIILMIGLNLFYQFWIHSALVERGPAWYEAVFNTPSHHRVHHASNVRYLDRNHGGVLIIWDRLFGTFAQESDDEKPRFGLTKNLVNPTVWQTLTHEYRSIALDCRRATNWQDRMRTLLWAPGWQFDGPDRRADTLRANAGQR
ncbi:MAG: sterol desaturase family protein [Pseudomonadaceae bacterium]|nr:sterol desaturase family protein [Pseudomonadaceae bacterium]